MVRTFSNVFKGARSAPRAVRRVIPHEVARPGGRGDLWGRTR
jgi:hypothetical protein